MPPAGRRPRAAEPDEDVLGRLGSRNRVSGYAAAVFETVTVAELEEIEDQLFRFARTVESNRRLRAALGDRDLPVAVRQQVIAQLLGTRSSRPPCAWPPTPCAGAGPVTSWPRSTPWSRTPPGPGAGGWPGSRPPTRSATPSSAS